jgi:hypothetical protein
VSRTELPEVLGSKEEFIKRMSTMYETFYEEEVPNKSTTTTTTTSVEKEKEKEEQEERPKKRRRKKLETLD